MSGALVALNPESDAFLDVKAVEHIMGLSRSPIIETEYQVAEEFFSCQPSEGAWTWTVQRILSKHTH